MQIEIRKATEADAEVAWLIRKRSILTGCSGHYPFEDLDTWTVGPHSLRFEQVVAERIHLATRTSPKGDEVVLGTGGIDFATGEIDAVFVSPEYMQQGVGRRIMSYLECVAIEAGHTRLTLNSTLNAVDFYRRCGFAGDLRRIYCSSRGVSLPCVAMEKRLAPFSRGV